MKASYFHYLFLFMGWKRYHYPESLLTANENNANIINKMSLIIHVGRVAPLSHGVKKCWSQYHW